MRKVLNLFGVTAVALCVGAIAGGARAQDAPAGDAAAGKKTYLATGCFFCHGRSGQGGALNGPAPILARTAMPWEGFENQLRHPINEMPAYAESVMSKKEVADIYAFLQSLPGPLPDAKSMAIFKD
ncbi:MAG: cytochrome c [Bradyrhizobiaceae bacterium]|nr:cytochrome c [Bradyrhizobiaceae bacterium]